MKRTALIATLLAAILSMLSACGGSADSHGRTATTTSALAPYTPSKDIQGAVEDNRAAQSSFAAAQSAAAAAPKQAGVTQTGAGRTVTYYSIQRPAATRAPKPESPGTEWVAIDVQACYGPGSYNFDNAFSWTLVDSTNGQYEPSHTGYSQFPSPEFPSGDTTVTDGQCIRGWIVFPVVTDHPIVRVAYTPYGADKPLLWNA